MKRPSKRLTIGIIVGIVCMLGAGLYTWQSLRTWSDYEARLTDGQREYSELKKIAISGKSPKERLAAIRSLDDKVAKRGDMCAVNSLYAWQAAIVPPFKDGVASCNQKLKQLTAVAGPLHTFREYLDATEGLQSAVGSLMATASLNESNWTTEGLASAKKLQKDLAGLKVGGDAATLKATAAGLADNLVKAWESLIKANTDKDKTAFLAASASVVKSYAEFAALADSADAAIQAKADDLIKASSQL